MRKSGVLMHISSLPSSWGIGTIGKAAKDFIDFLYESKQKYWQILPITPTGFGDSPYQSFSAFAGNPYFVDLDMLFEWGLLEKSDYCYLAWGDDPVNVDYGLIYENRFHVLRKAACSFLSSPNNEYFEFCSYNKYWLDDYAFFMAIKDNHGGDSWMQWDWDLRVRKKECLEKLKESIKSDIEFYKVIQYFFFRQWNVLKSYAEKKNILIIGDIPLYVSTDSSDVWANPNLFMLDKELNPINVAGCPPDSFSEDGQLWGNPIYKWDEMKKNNFEWWVKRIRHQYSIHDVLRIDHFRGFDEYYAIPYGSKTARSGQWLKGPGIEFFNALNTALGKRPIIAEDLGYLNDSVRNLLAECGFPGMKILQFAFSSNEDSNYLPHNFVKNCVGYTGTHDNDTINGWFKTVPSNDAIKAREYMRIHKDESQAKAMISILWGSVSNLVIAQMQDLLELGCEARMNTPSTLGNNWKWRMSPETDLSRISEWLRNITELYGR